MTQVYEVLAAGYGARGDDTTDDRVIWVCVDYADQLPSLEEMVNRIDGTVLKDPVTDKDAREGCDFAWPYDQRGLASVRHFKRNRPKV